MSPLPEADVAGPGNPGTAGACRHDQYGAAPAGLRERKKARTRAVIRQHAFRLFRDQGYDATTIEQIADVAEVSQSTFFRYFPTKEDVVLQDGVDELWAEAVRAQPAELGPLAALRRAMQDTFSRMTPEVMDQMRQTVELTLTVPAVRARSLDELARTIGVIARLTGERAGRSADDLEVRTFAGAVLGIAMAVWFASSGDLTEYLRQFERAIELLEAGLPL